MSTNRVAVVESQLDLFLSQAQPAAKVLGAEDCLRPGSRLTAGVAFDLFADMALSRALDVAARELKKTNRSFYTISSAGHEVNVVLGSLLRPTDPCFLHYRSGALMMARSRHSPDFDPALETMLGVCASSDDLTSGGRHKVWGSKELWVPPQTSTIASHLPKAVGAAFGIGRAKRMGIESGVPASTVVCCTFGDASFNHATAQTGLNSSRYAGRHGRPAPVLWVCEDNGIGISTATPKGWIRDSIDGRSDMPYIEAAGELDEIYEAAAVAIATCRRRRGPVFLHMKTVRLWGHAGSDIETGYRELSEIEKNEARDPLLAAARLLISTGAATPMQLTEIVDQARRRAKEAGEDAASRPKLTSREDVMKSLAPWDEAQVRYAATAPIEPAERKEIFGTHLPEKATTPARRTLAAMINATLQDELIKSPETVLFGEDVGRKGGVYGVTSGLQEHFGPRRCFDTVLDETSILGISQGLALMGLLPMPEIQYLAYLHNAIDQLRGEACSLQFFSNDQFRNPMVVRIQGFGYQKGFGGHFHNDPSIGALREIPGLILAVPARGDDAVKMLRGAVAAAKTCGRIVVMVEPIALYHERDLYETGDGGWLSDYPLADGSEDCALLPGEVGVYHPYHRDVLIVSYGNGLRMSLRAAKHLEEEHGLRARVLDLRWLNPLPFDAIRLHAEECCGVLVADECRASGAGIADAVISNLAENDYRYPLRSVRSADTYVPLGPAADLVLMSEEDIIEGALSAAGRR
ncbi:MAG: MFS transporter [Planctomycetes bacterium]|nr:MFS transporter [Planctomycetota bacterium]MCP4771271.1 MFS transporter [Planctomycetota bacterium]MCP4862002.1 MFS transporter [Planctomycetota bacterium]